MMNTEDYVTYDQAVKLKEMGFDWGCAYCYEKGRLTSNYNFVSEFLGFIDNYKILTENLTYSVNKNCPNIDVFDAPTLSQAVKWLREVKGILVVCTPEEEYYNYNFKYLTGNWICELWRGKEDNWNPTEKVYQTYEDALSDGINEALKL